MATGALPFRGESSGLIFEAILNRPLLSPLRLNPDLPPDLERFISKALEKDRMLRYQSAAEMRSDLLRLKRDTETGRAVAAGSGTVPAAQDVATGPQRGVPPSTSVPGFAPSSSDAMKVAELRTAGGKKLWKILGVASVLVIALGGIFVWFLTLRQPKKGEPKLSQLTDNAGEIAIGSGTISPDGKYVAYWDTRGIHLKLLSTGEMKTIPQPVVSRREKARFHKRPAHHGGRQVRSGDSNAGPGGWILHYCRVQFYSDGFPASPHQLGGVLLGWIQRHVRRKESGVSQVLAVFQHLCRRFRPKHPNLEYSSPIVVY